MVRVASVIAAVLLAAGSAASQQIIFQTMPGVPPQGPARDTSQQKPGTAIVRGRVFAADKIGRAHV